MSGDTQGPFILWTDYGTEGWRPQSFATLKEALEAPRFSASPFVITRALDYDVVERCPVAIPQMQQARLHVEEGHLQAEWGRMQKASKNDAL